MPLPVHSIIRHVIPWSFVAGLLLASGCGKPASVEDCERIVARITELELEAAEISDPEVVRAQVDSTKSAFGEAARAECVGRRISSGSLACVDQATSARQIVEECFD